MLKVTLHHLKTDKIHTYLAVHLNTGNHSPVRLRVKHTATLPAHSLVEGALQLVLLVLVHLREPVQHQLATGRC